MAVGDTQSIGGIEFLGHIGIGDMQEPLQHSRHLLLARMAVARDSHLYLHRRVLIYGDVATQSRSDSHSLRMHNLNHRLGVLIHELCLDGERGRM